MTSRHSVMVIAGPTAAGKTAAAVNVAERLSGEIISCDAMQVYKEVSIASNKPNAQMRSAVKHHLIDIVSVEEVFDVVKFYNSASRRIQDILNEGMLPIVSGGTGMYAQVLMDGIFESPDIDPAVRDELMREAEEQGHEALHERLKEVDPAAAAKIHANDLKRVIRALEVYAAEGRPISERQKERQGLCETHDVKAFVLNLERDVLYRRINERVDAMFNDGLVDEIQHLKNFTLSKTARSVIGIPEVTGYLDGEYSLDEARELMKKNTRNFAKRQLTWFRKDSRWNWIELDENDTAEIAAEKIITAYES